MADWWTQRNRRAGAAGLVLAGSVLQGFARAPHAKGYTSQSWHGRRDVVDDALLGVMGSVMLGAPLAYAASARLRRYDYDLPPAGRRALAGAGVALGVASLWLFHRSHEDLGSNWSPHVELTDAQELVTRGVYARVRHPMYASQVLAGLAQACLLQNAVAGPSGLLGFLPLYLRRVATEEAAMRDRFGAAWDAYAARTGRLVPRRSGPARGE